MSNGESLKSIVPTLRGFNHSRPPEALGVVMKKAQRTKRGEGVDPVDVAVGEAIRKGRNLRGLSQEKLGEEIGMTFQQIQKYEKGTNRVAASTLFYISCILDVPISAFYAGIKYKESPLDIFDLSNNEIQLVRTYRFAKDKRQQAHILDILKQIVKIQNG